ncbi:TIGR03086 family metal-binding protein [Kribbella sp. CA-293567]|uniref:TIGR03086 family metal-binding protein n=1 Tax=Kribbella sp. CA-293567 TaxID=3002436 RepID=UPI0022DE669F|nr:TIGR03086 family metal-binding protein [Kribbella sp. CA-293567]WBQ07553.1 TIGR03086 family metal-binding protein [Kribbella sp. CA-293567]
MIDLQPACERLGELVAGINDDQLAAGTPCAEYTVKDLLNHVDDGARGFAQAANSFAAGALAADGDAGAALDFDGEWRQVLGQRLEVLAKAWSDPAAWAGESDLAGLALSNEEWGKIALTEVVVHGWDLAKATGLPFELPPETVRACYEHVAGFLVEPPVPELWGPPVDVATEAPLMDRLVGVAGRWP